MGFRWDFDGFGTSTWQDVSLWILVQSGNVKVA